MPQAFKQIACCWLPCLYLLLGNLPCESDELSIAFGINRPPFVYQEDNQWKGFEIKLVAEALKFKGHVITNTKHFANKRLGLAVSNMGFDGAAAVQYQDDGTFYLENFISYQNFAISRKMDNLKITSIKDLTQYKPVAWQNAYINLGQEYAKHFGPNVTLDYMKDYIEFVNQDNQNSYFWHGRANVIIIDKTIFLWHRKRLYPKYKTQVEMVYHNLFDKHTHYKANFKSQAIRDDFNLGLKHLRDSGRYQKIIDKYIRIE